MGSRSIRIFMLTTLVLCIPIAGAQSSPQSADEVNCHPVSQRTGELGCWILADQPVGSLTESQAFWHIDTYPTQEAANAAKGTRGAVVTSFGKTWLLTIETSEWHSPAGGKHIATIGPLPRLPADKYVATYMEGVFTPGMKSAIHDHPGPEIFYTMTGDICLESPTGISLGRSSSPPVIIPGGVPMQLTATGTEKRQGLTLILHDASKPSGHPVHDWTPKGLCK